MDTEASETVTRITGVSEEQPENLIEQLRAKRRDIAENKETFIPVPGYDKSPPVLLIKYRLIEGKELVLIGQRVQRETKDRWERQIRAAVDTLVTACSGLYITVEDGKEPQPLTVNGEHIRGFTRQLAEALDFADRVSNPDSPREVAFGLFAGNEIMISQHAFQLNRWMGDTSVDVSQEFMEGNL